MYIQKIQSINSLNRIKQPHFQAKFSQEAVNHFLQELEFKDMDDVPQVYTMLDIIKKQAGNNAQIKKFGNWFQLQIDGVSLNNERKYLAALHALQDATVNHKNTLLKETPIKRVSEEIFKSMWLKNSNKTKQDIKNIFKD